MPVIGATAGRAYLGLALMIALTLLTRLPFLGHPAPDFDEQLYSLIGQKMMQGYVPYIDIWDRKPVGLFLIYAAAHGLGGAAPLAYQLVALVACLIGGWQVFRLATRITDPLSAGFSSGLYPVLMAIYGSHSGQSEIFYTPLMLGMAGLVLSGADQPAPGRALPHLAGAMALGGLALQVKYTVLPPCLWFGMVALWLLHRKGARGLQIAGAAVGFAVLGLLPTIMAAGWYATHGALDAFIFANLLSIRLRAPMPAAYALTRQVMDLLPLAMVTVGGLIYAARRAARRAARTPLPLAWWLALGWLVSAVAALFMGTTVYTYYYAALTPCVILVALPMVERANRLGPWLLAGILVWLVAVFNPPRQFDHAAQERAALDRIARMAGPHVGTQRHRLFVYDGPVALYALTGSRLPTRFIYPDHLNNALENHALPVDPATEVARILQEQPGALVTSPQPVTVRNAATQACVNAALAQDYRLALTVMFQSRPLQLWIRRNPYPVHPIA